jgi:hypothetical protein
MLQSSGRNWTRTALAALAALAITTGASAAPFLIDFETEDDFLPGPATPLVNGQKIDTEFGNLFTVTSTVTGGGNGHLGPAIFDSSNPGPNVGGPDPDLLVNLGNIMILQADESPATTLDPTYGTLFDTPNDEATNNDAGSIFFNFLLPVSLTSVDLVDVNGGAHMTLTLTDGSNLTRVYDVPMQWTTDVQVAPTGWQTLDLTTLANQPSEPNAAGGDATATEDAGFDPDNVLSLEVNIMGSGGIDNLRFVPEPTTALLLGLGLFGVTARRRR